MASINFNWFGENWFQKPPNPITPLNLISFTQSNLSTSSPTTTPNFSSITASNLFGGKSKKPEPESPYKPIRDQYVWECENLPDYHQAPEVEQVLNEDPVFEKKENPTEAEIKENAELLEEISRSGILKFLCRAEEIADEINEMELKENEIPYRGEDRKFWQAVPHVKGLDGRPMPRKAIKSRKESDDKFWDFMKQFQFGLWGYRQRPYPSERPIDVAQAIGYKRLEKRYYDFIMRSGGFYYKDRLGRTRGPLELITLKTAWSGGVIDKDTFIWGEDMDEWAPIHMVYGLERAIATWDVRLGAAAIAAFHKLTKGIPPWVPLKGHEKKTYKKLQQEAIESKRRDLAVLEANGGIWPGVRIPSHALFLWASGSELTTILEADHMPNKYIPKDLRIELAKAIPGLRPWEVLSIEQAMDQITYGGEWYREPLGSKTAHLPYLKRWNNFILKKVKTYLYIVNQTNKHLVKTVPGWSSITEWIRADLAARDERRKQKKAIEKEIALFGRPISKFD